MLPTSGACPTIGTLHQKDGPTGDIALLLASHSSGGQTREVGRHQRPRAALNNRLGGFCLFVLKERRTWDICPRLSSTHQKTSSINSAARLRQNLDLMISSLTPKISRQMSDKCPDIHQAFPPPQLVFLGSCRLYINAAVSNRLNIRGDVVGGSDGSSESLQGSEPASIRALGVPSPVPLRRRPNAGPFPRRHVAANAAPR